MVELEWNPNLVPSVKLGLQVAQILLTFAVWCLEIAVFVAQDAQKNGKNAWTFSVCFLSIPAWLYLIMAPRFDRARRVASPHAMLFVDVLFAILWLSAFATQAAFNTAGLCGQTCKLSKAIVGLGVFISLLFVATAAVSAYSLCYYAANGNLPGYNPRPSRGRESTANIDPDKAAFSMHPTDEEAYAPIHREDHDVEHGGPHSSLGRYDNANPYAADAHDDPAHGYAPENTYGPVAGGLPPASQSYVGAGGYADGPAHFPAAPYDRSHA